MGQYLCAALGGPQNYEGASMIEAHKGLEISAGDWQIFSRHLEATFETFGLSESLKSQLVTMIDALQPEIIAA